VVTSALEDLLPLCSGYKKMIFFAEMFAKLKMITASAL